MVQVWNDVGVVIQYNSEDEQSITVEFHDTATHHAMHVNNALGHILADLSTSAVLLACEADDKNPRYHHKRLYISVDANKRPVTSRLLPASSYNQKSRLSEKLFLTCCSSELYSKMRLPDLYSTIEIVLLFSITCDVCCHCSKLVYVENCLLNKDGCCCWGMCCCCCALKPAGLHALWLVGQC